MTGDARAIDPTGQRRGDTRRSGRPEYPDQAQPSQVAPDARDDMIGPQAEEGCPEDGEDESEPGDEDDEAGAVADGSVTVVVVLVEAYCEPG